MKPTAGYNRVVSLGTEGYNAEGETCPDCGAEAEWHTCDTCGEAGWIIDCGHYAQPRPIAPGRRNGTDLGNTYCDNCA